MIFSFHKQGKSGSESTWQFFDELMRRRLKTALAYEGRAFLGLIKLSSNDEV
jgi:hypothetical protein